MINRLTLLFSMILFFAIDSISAMEKIDKAPLPITAISIHPKNPKQLAIGRSDNNGNSEIGILDLETNKYSVQVKNKKNPDNKKICKILFNSDGTINPIFGELQKWDPNNPNSVTNSPIYYSNRADYYNENGKVLYYAHVCTNTKQVTIKDKNNDIISGNFLSIAKNCLSTEFSQNGKVLATITVSEGDPLIDIYTYDTQNYLSLFRNDFMFIERASTAAFVNDLTLAVVLENTKIKLLKINPENRMFDRSNMSVIDINPGKQSNSGQNSIIYRLISQYKIPLGCAVVILSWILYKRFFA